MGTFQTTASSGISSSESWYSSSSSFIVLRVCLGPKAFLAPKKLTGLRLGTEDGERVKELLLEPLMKDLVGDGDLESFERAV